MGDSFKATNCKEAVKEIPGVAPVVGSRGSTRRPAGAARLRMGNESTRQGGEGAVHGTSFEKLDPLASAGRLVGDTELGELLRVVASHVPDHLLIQDRELRYLLVVNPPLGIAQSEMIGRRDEDFLDAADAAKLTELKRQLLESGKPLRVEISLVSRSGTIERFDGTYVPRRNGSGQVDGLIGYVRNVTDRWKWEETLRQTLGDLRRSQRAARIGSYRFEFERGSWTSSETMDEVLGIGRDYARTAETWAALIHPEDRDALARYVTDEVLSKWGRYDREFRVVRPADGSEIWVHGWGEVERDSVGKAIAMFGCIQDISERKEAEERFKLVANATFEGISVIEQGQIILANEQLAEMFGYGKGELLGKLAIDFVAPESRANVVRRFADGDAGPSEFVGLRKDGTRFTAEVRSRLTGKAGSSLRVSAIRDVSERKVVEETLRDADRRKDEFLAMLSHELRNPLAPIRSSLYVLDRSAPGGERARRAQAIIGRQVGHLARLVDDLLDVTRITRGKIELRRERLDLVDLVSRTAEDFRSAFADAGVLLEVQCPATPFWVQGDRTRLAQVVGNLLQNAAKFSPPESRTVLSLAEDSLRGRAFLEVEDQGRGIEPSILPRVFEPFTQAETTLDRSRGGLGLGLSLVKGLVEMHGGTVEARSAGLGRGATFTVTLPLDPAGAVKPSEVAFAVCTTSRRILVIEDNADAAEALRDALELAGHKVTVELHGPDGIRAARSFQPDVILCDIGLPEMDGFAVARALRASPDLGPFLLVALTGYAQPEDVEKAKEAGFDLHLAKPPTMEKLAEVLQRAPGFTARGSESARY